MKRMKIFSKWTNFAIVLFAAIFFPFQDNGHAEIKPVKPQFQQQFPEMGSLVKPPGQLLCPDVKVSFTMAKTPSGLVVLKSTITNVGNRDFSTLSQANWDVNWMEYPQGSYQYISNER
ncbi:MAG: hypothetical protein V1793_11500 [Pseudomonadota bacterium]